MMLLLRKQHGNGTFHTFMATALKKHLQFVLKLEGTCVCVCACVCVCVCAYAHAHARVCESISYSAIVL